MRRGYASRSSAALWAAVAAGTLALPAALHADTYPGNGDTGFGGPIGLGSLELTDDGATLSGNLTKGGTNGFNDILVIYVDSQPGGFADTSTLNDQADAHRKAVSGTSHFEADSLLIFPEGFLPDYAITVSNYYAGGWQIVGAGSHNVTANGNVSPNGNNNAANYTFSMPLTAVGVAPGAGQSMNMLGTYISDTAFRSTEAIAGNVSNAQGQGWVTFTGTATASYTSTTLPGVWLGGTGNWSDTAKWTNATVPNDAGAHARIDNGNAFATSSTTLDQDATVGQLSVGAAESLTIDPTRNLTIAGPADSAVSGTFTNNGTLNVLGGTTTVTNGIKGNGGLVIGSGGKVAVPAATPSSYDGGANIPSGNDATGSKISSLLIGGTGQLDLGNSDMAIDHDGSLSIQTIADLVASGYNGGSWDGAGIVASSALLDNTVFGLGYAENGDPEAIPDPYNDTDHQFFGIPVDSTSVLLKFTWLGDLNLDGFVNFSDLVVFNGEFDDGATTGRFWYEGDFDYDGDVDFSDLVIFNGAYDENKASMPEPGAASVLAAAAGIGALRRGRRAGRA